MHRMDGNYSCSSTPFGGSEEYIRKDDVIEWVKHRMSFEQGFESEDAEHGYKSALEDIISEINKL